MKNDIEQKSINIISDTKISIQDLAEYHSEVYVSSILGMSDDEPTKQTIKNQYKEAFYEQVRKSI